MTLGDLAQYICTKVGQTDKDSIAACRLFLRRRYQMIWDYALWKESLFTKSIGTGTGTCVLPATCDQVVAVRIGFTPVPLLDQTTLMRTDPGAYTRTGTTPDGFIFLSPTCLGTAIASTTVITAFSSSALDNAQTLHLVGELSNGLEVREDLVLTGTTPVSSVNGYANVLSASLSAPCAGNVTVAATGSDTIVAGLTNLESRPRVKILEYGSGTVTVTFLCKRRFTDLLSDTDVPLLRNSENTLLAWATADMLERQRQYAKAELKNKEGAAQLQLMLDLEKNQSANEHRIVPVDLHGTSVRASFGTDGKGVW